MFSRDGITCLSGTTATRHPIRIVGTIGSFCRAHGTGPLHNLCGLKISTARTCRNTHREIHEFLGTPYTTSVIFAEGTARDVGLITCDCKLGFVGPNRRVIIAVTRRRDGVLP